MDIDEFVGLSPNIIRRDTELMQLYIKFYEAAFSVIPNCAGCSFKSGFRKLQQYAKTGEKNIKFDTNTNEMKTDKTFLLKTQFTNKILTYVKDGKTYRSYGYNLSEDFAKELVASGKEDIFKTLPINVKKINSEGGSVKSSKEFVENIESEKSKGSVNYESMNYRKELMPLYEEVKESTGKEAESNKKKHVIKFLKANES